MVQGLAINCGMLGLAAAGGRGQDYTASEKTFNENLLLGITTSYELPKKIKQFKGKLLILM